MILTFHELKEKMAEQLDEVTLLEVLGISSQELVDRFEDKIEARYARLCEDFTSEM